MPVLTARTRFAPPMAAIEALFERTAWLPHRLARDPEYYRSAIVAAGHLGPNLLARVGIPGPPEWRRMLLAAVEAESLSAELEPDAFGIVPTLVMKATVHEWALGRLTVEELAARTEYHLALSLLAFATEHSRTSLLARTNGAEQTLRALQNVEASSI